VISICRFDAVRRISGGRCLGSLLDRERSQNAAAVVAPVVKLRLAASLQRRAPYETLRMNCPNCGHEQHDTIKSGSCGIYFTKFLRRHHARAPRCGRGVAQRHASGFGWGAIALTAIYQRHPQQSFCARLVAAACNSSTNAGCRAARARAGGARVVAAAGDRGPGASVAGARSAAGWLGQGPVVMRTVIFCCLALMAGCATLEPNAVRAFVGHESHATQHEPFTNHTTNYGRGAEVGIITHWQRGPMSIDLSESYSLQGTDGAHVPREAFELKAGWEVWHR